MQVQLQSQSEFSVGAGLIPAFPVSLITVQATLPRFQAAGSKGKFRESGPAVSGTALQKGKIRCRCKPKRGANEGEQQNRI
jgi:hypothetical protein